MADISKIKLPNGTTYDIKDIVARERGLPAGGNAGQVLSKIDGTDYNTEWIDPPSGGGDGNGYRKTILWSGYKADTGTITLNDSVENYDIVLIKVTSHPNQPSSNYYESYFTVLPNEIVYNQTAQYCLLAIRSTAHYGDGSLDCHFSSPTSFVIETISIDGDSRLTKPAVLEVIGLKLSTTETAFIYSNEERVVGVWTDNRPLYQKTITATITSKVQWIDSGVIDDAEIHHVWGALKADNDNIINLNSSDPEAQVGIDTIIKDIITSGYWSVLFRTTFNSMTGEATITLQYTKTTDTPGSGPYVTSGSYAHHYSTDEQVVGTWIDGSTLYEKTQYGGITFSTQGTWYDTNITNIDKIVSVEGSIYRGTASEDGEPINIGYWNASIISNWILRDHTLKVKMERIASGEVYRLNSITVRYTKTS